MYTKENPLRIAGVFSGGASGIRYIAQNDKNFGINYKFVGGFTDDRNASGITPFINSTGVIPCSFDIKTFYRENGNAKLSDMNVRAKYFEKFVILVNTCSPDLILFSGFKWMITDELLNPFKRRIINVHPGDLRVTGSDQKPLYVGLHTIPVQKALDNGETKLYSTIHFIEKEMDTGEIICVSDGMPVVSGKSAQDLQNEMKDACDGPAFIKALELICSGEIKLG